MKTAILFLIFLHLPALATIPVKEQTSDCTLQRDERDFTDGTERRKKVVVLTSSAGGGHISAANAVKGALGSEDYDVVILDILKNRLMAEDKFDEYFSREEWNKLWMTIKMQPLAETYISNFHHRAISGVIGKENPDLIISVFPVANYVYKDIAEKIKVPFVIIPTDLDPLAFINGISEGGNDSGKKSGDFEIELAMDDPVMKKTLKERGIRSTSIIGYPIRKEMEVLARKYRHSDKELMQELDDLRRELDIAPEDKTVLLSMGAKGFGQQTIEEYIDTIVKNEDSLLPADGDAQLHVIVAAGSNKDLLALVESKAQELRSLGRRIVVHPEGWMDARQMGKRMAIADVLFIKPGGSTVAEGLAFNKKILFKSDSAQALPWEAYNMQFVVNNGWGDSLNYKTSAGIDRSDFLAKLSKNLNQNRNARPTPENNFSQKIREVVKNVITKAEEQRAQMAQSSGAADGEEGAFSKMTHFLKRLF